jgi:hypothetical protein
MVICCETRLLRIIVPGYYGLHYHVIADYITRLLCFYYVLHTVILFIFIFFLLFLVVELSLKAIDK